MTWRGIVGKGFTPETFQQYVAGIKFEAWRPSFVVVHNTDAPTLATYRSWRTRARPVTGEQWMRNLEGYYKGLGWKAGPHLFVADDKIWVFSPLTGPGTHSPSWNAISWGVETVGNYDTEPFDPKVKANLVAALATLHIARGLSPDTLRFHKEDPRTTHKDCPGKHIVKADLIAAVKAAIAERVPGEHKPIPPHVAEAGGPIHDYMPWILEDEGGYAERATEPGGAVNKGVSMETFRQWRTQNGKPMPTFADLKVLTDAEAEAIYEELYYKQINGGKLPKWVDYCVLDSAINDGLGGARAIARDALGVKILSTNWAMIATLIHAQMPEDFVMKFTEARLAHAKQKSGWPKYGDGWSKRFARVQSRTLEKLKETKK